MQQTKGHGQIMQQTKGHGQIMQQTTWQTLRYQQASQLQFRARHTGAVEDSLAWERYMRKTVYMENMARALAAALDHRYRVVHGHLVRHQGRVVHLEHVVIGPTGIYLIETMGQEPAEWQNDLARNIAFFRDVLGADAHHFSCLIIQREPLQAPLPLGAHPVESPEVALSIITGAGTPVPPLVADELWGTLHALQTTESAPLPARAPLWRRTGRLGQANLALLAVLHILIGLSDSDFFGAVLGGFFVVGIPIGLVWLLLQRIEKEWLRRGWMWGLLGLQSLLFLLFFGDLFY